MLGKIFGVMCLISVISGIFTGKLTELGGAVLDGAEAATALTISLVGIMCLWCGVMRVLQNAGIIDILSRFLSPILKCFFPDAAKGGKNGGKDEIVASISANLLGIGNAATPLALSAMKKLYEAHISRGGKAGQASRDMITLAVLNTASANLLPTTILALRRSAGSEHPFSVVLPIQLCSIACATFALFITRAMGITEKRIKGKIK